MFLLSSFHLFHLFPLPPRCLHASSGFFFGQIRGSGSHGSHPQVLDPAAPLREETVECRRLWGGGAWVKTCAARGSNSSQKPAANSSFLRLLQGVIFRKSHLFEPRPVGFLPNSMGGRGVCVCVWNHFFSMLFDVFPSICICVCVHY